MRRQHLITHLEWRPWDSTALEKSLTCRLGTKATAWTAARKAVRLVQLSAAYTEVSTLYMCSVGLQEAYRWHWPASKDI